MDIKENSPYDKILRTLVFLLVGITPIIMFPKWRQIITPVIDPVLNFNTGGFFDLFTYYKSVFSLLLIVAIFLIFSIKIISRRQSLKSSNIEVPLMIFTFSLCISLFLTTHKTITLWGGCTRNFGVITYLACSLLLLIISNLEIGNKWVKVVEYGLYPVLLVNVILITLSYYGVNLLNNELLAYVILGEFSHRITDGSSIPTTLGHYNYLSGMGGILFAFYAGKAVFEVNRTLRIRIVYILAAVLAGVIVFASKSLSGVVTMAFIVAVLLPLIMTSRKKESFGYFVSISILTGIAWVFLSLYDVSFVKELVQDAGLLVASAGLGLLLVGCYLLLKNWKNLNKKRLIIIGGLVISICLTGTFIIAPKVVKTVESEMSRIDTSEILQRLEKDEFDFPEAKFGWGTGRVYIWKSTMGLIAERPFFGYGLDTLPFEFNQGDPAKIAGINDPSTIVDKPHSIYLNMLYGAGGITFLAYMAIIFGVIKKAVKALIKGTKYDVYIWPLLLGILAYLYQGLFNDPVQGVEQVFWVMMGITYGLSANALQIEDNILKTTRKRSVRGAFL